MALRLVLLIQSFELRLVRRFQALPMEPQDPGPRRKLDRCQLIGPGSQQASRYQQLSELHTPSLGAALRRVEGAAVGVAVNDAEDESITEQTR